MLGMSGLETRRQLSWDDDALFEVLTGLALTVGERRVPSRHVIRCSI